MNPVTRVVLVLPALVLLCLPLSASAADWAPVTDAEKNLQSNPLDPGAGALVLFKRGHIEVNKLNSSLWVTKIQTYTRIKILTDAGRDAGNVVIDAPKNLRFSKVEGRTILPSGEIVPLDTSKVFHGISFQEKNFAILATSFAFSSAQPGAIIEYQTEETADWFYSPPWIFDTRGLATLQSSLTTVVNDDLAMAELPLDTTVNKVSVARKQTSLGLQTDFAVQNLRPVRNEPFAVPFRDRAVMVLFNPYEIVFSGRVFPIIKTWDDVATQVSEMVTNMNKEDRAVASKAKELADKLPDPRARAEAIYKYLQQNVTSSNLIGFYLNRSADEVINSKKADPDDINAVFVTMLKEVKVDAELVLVATQNWQTLIKQFPNLSEFSRMIVRVNLKSGPVFVDAADAAAPFGELPWFERGVLGMVVKGGKIQQADIPDGVSDRNTSVSKLTLRLSPDWKAEGDADLSFGGTKAIDFRSTLVDESSDKTEKYLANYFAFGHGDAAPSAITHPDFGDSSQPMAVKAHVEFVLSDQAGPGSVLFNPWMAGPQFQAPAFKSGQRQGLILFEGPEKQVTVNTWNLPPEIHVEKLPDAVNVQGDLADYAHACTQDGATLTCTRTFTLKKSSMMEPTGYPATKKFFDEVAQHEQEVIVLQKR